MHQCKRLDYVAPIKRGRVGGSGGTCSLSAPPQQGLGSNFQAYDIHFPCFL